MKTPPNSLDQIATPPPRETKLTRNDQGGSAVVSVSKDHCWQQLALVAVEEENPLDKALALLGPHYRADRAWAGRYNDAYTHFGGVSDWVGAGIASHLHEVQGVSVDLIPGLHKKLMRGETVAIPDVERMPRQSRALQAELRRENVLSTIAHPLFFAGKVIGFFGFDHVHELAQWTTVDLEQLPALGRFLGALMHRQLSVAPPADPPAKTHRPIYVTEPTGLKALTSEEVHFIEADGDYSRVYLLDGRSYFERRSLRNWIEQLPRQRFLRVHQSYLVNGARIAKLERGSRWALYLQDVQEPIPVGRAFRYAVRLHMGF